MADLKTHASLTEQVQKLIDHGLIISDKQWAEHLLSCINYYRLSGYLYDFKDKLSGNYQKGITLEQIKKIYDFDKKLNQILRFALEDIEETLKTRLSYCLTSHFPNDPLIYLKKDPYRPSFDYQNFKNLFYKTVNQNHNLPFVKHHIKDYDKKFPMWVAVELFTMGNLYAVYDNLQTCYKKEIAKIYNTGPNQLSNWIKNLTYTRNHLAHYMRIYNYNFGRTPITCKKHSHSFPVSNKIFDQIFILRCMYSDPSEWNNYVLLEIEALLESDTTYIKLADLGFPQDWKKILTLSSES